MVFGLFKKEEYADLILRNGTIYTQDFQFPKTEAVACRNGKIIAVGDNESIDAFAGPHTEILDMTGRFVLPGMINCYSNAAMAVFEDMYIDLSCCGTLDDIIDVLAENAAEGDDAIYGAGYDNYIFSAEDTGDDDELRGLCRALDKVSINTPVIIMSQDGIDCRFNTAAINLIKQSAEEDEIDIITYDYILSVLLPLDYDELEEKIYETCRQLQYKGFTGVMSLQTPEYLDEIFRDQLFAFYNEGRLPLRYFGSFYTSVPLHPQGLLSRLQSRKITCIESDGYLYSDHLNMITRESGEGITLPGDYLSSVLEDVPSYGINVLIEAENKNSLKAAYEGVNHGMAKGAKTSIVISSDSALDEEEIHEYPYAELTTVIPQTGSYGSSPCAECPDITEAITKLTTGAAYIIGKDNMFGSIEKGKAADFSVYDTDPYSLSPSVFSRTYAIMTIIGGETVYDAEAENMEELYSLMSTQYI